MQIDRSIYDREIIASDHTLPMPVDIVESDIDLYWQIAHDMCERVEEKNRRGERSVFIVPVGPVFQYRRFVRLCARRGVSLRDSSWFFMDEYVDANGKWIDEASPLSFRGFVQREFVAAAPAELELQPENVHFPDPRDPLRYDAQLQELGGADSCYAGVGINGHLAFNEPPEPPKEMSAEQFGALPTRVLSLSRETITINSNTALRGAYEQVPKQAVTVGMKQILSAGRLRIYLNRPWQSAVVRKLLFAPVHSAVPATLARRHPDVRIMLTAEVAEKPDFGLR